MFVYGSVVWIATEGLVFTKLCLVNLSRALPASVRDGQGQYVIRLTNQIL